MIECYDKAIKLQNPWAMIFKAHMYQSELKPIEAAELYGQARELLTSSKLFGSSEIRDLHKHFDVGVASLYSWRYPAETDQTEFEYRRHLAEGFVLTSAPFLSWLAKDRQLTDKQKIRHAFSAIEAKKYNSNIPNIPEGLLSLCFSDIHQKLVAAIEQESALSEQESQEIRKKVQLLKDVNLGDRWSGELKRVELLLTSDSQDRKLRPLFGRFFAIEAAKGTTSKKEEEQKPFFHSFSIND
jgi:hypothetical protein